MLRCCFSGPAQPALACSLGRGSPDSSPKLTSSPAQTSSPSHHPSTRSEGSPAHDVSPGTSASSPAAPSPPTHVICRSDRTRFKPKRLDIYYTGSEANAVVYPLSSHLTYDNVTPVCRAFFAAIA
ncbi:unnamed protein product [Linum trigynum]|uniref:Uncharacterized protein n=1 Tax=Linum trigynum TaxID=586398 RepID=A0AAV2E8B1_9ROSI